MLPTSHTCASRHMYTDAWPDAYALSIYKRAVPPAVVPKPSHPSFLWTLITPLKNPSHLTRLLAYLPHRATCGTCRTRLVTLPRTGRFSSCLLRSPWHHLYRLLSLYTGFSLRYLTTPWLSNERNPSPHHLRTHYRPRVRLLLLWRLKLKLIYIHRSAQPPTAGLPDPNMTDSAPLVINENTGTHKPLSSE